MTRFRYLAVSSVGDPVSGELEAASRSEATSLLREKGLDPVRVSPGRMSRMKALLLADLGEGGAAALKLRRAFAGDLAMLRGAGIPIDQALTIMARGQDASAALAQRIMSRTASGLSLSAALGTESATFNDASVSMVAAGEESGNLAEALHTLSDLTEEELEIRSEVLSSLVYPAVLIVASCLAIGVMVGHVLPNLERLFLQSGREIPGMTGVIFDIGRAIRVAAFPALISLLALAPLTIVAMRTTYGRAVFDRMLLRLPLFGPIARDGNIGAACLTIGRLLSAGTSADRAIELGGQNCANSIFRQDFHRAAEMVRSGRTVADAFATISFMPVRVSDMISIGENSGSLAKMLTDVAAMLKRSAKAARASLLGALQPVLTASIGVVVAAIVYAVLTALLSMNEMAF